MHLSASAANHRPLSSQDPSWLWQRTPSMFIPANRMYADCAWFPFTRLSSALHFIIVERNASSPSFECRYDAAKYQCVGRQKMALGGLRE